MENTENLTTEAEKVDITEQNEQSSEPKELKVEEIPPVSQKRSLSPDPDARDPIAAKRAKETDDRPIKATLVNESGLITSDQFNILQKYLFNCVLDSLLDANVPRIENTSLQEGVIKVSCIGQTTFDWLRHVVHRSKALWPGERLRVLTCNQFSLFSALIYVRITLPGEILPNETVFNLLKRQNPRIDTSHWQFCSAKQNSTGQTICIRMDILSVRELAKDHRLFYGIGSVYAQLSNPARKLRHKPLPWRK